jgi:hypothetical protein
MRIMTEADFQKRLADAFFGSLHKMNAVHITAEQVDTLDRRQEKLALIRELRDQTNSRATYDRCVAIVGERGA